MSDADLALVQGGNIFGDIWRSIKKAVAAVTEAIKRRTPPIVPLPVVY